MEKPDIYTIDLKGIASDSVTLDFQLGDAFFDGIEASAIRKGDVHATVEIRKTSSDSFRMDFRMQGFVSVPCDRCLDDLEVPVASSDVLLVRFGDSYSEDENEIVVPEDDGRIDVAWFLYEFMALGIPLKHVHEPGACNEQMMAKLGEYLSAPQDGAEDDLSSSKGSTKEIDSRWNELKKLIDK